MATIFAQRHAGAWVGEDQAEVQARSWLAPVDLIAYASDGRLAGRFDRGRLSNRLDRPRTLVLSNVLLRGLAGEQAGHLPLMTVRTEDLLVIEVAARQRRNRRPSMFRTTLSMQVGPYRVRGDVGVLPGSDPFAAFTGSRHMVAVTDAWIEYPVGASVRRHLAHNLLVNRSRTDWVALASDIEREGRPQALLRGVEEAVDR